MASMTNARVRLVLSSVRRFGRLTPAKRKLAPGAAFALPLARLVTGLPLRAAGCGCSALKRSCVARPIPQLPGLAVRTFRERLGGSWGRWPPTRRLARSAFLRLRTNAQPPTPTFTPPSASETGRNLAKTESSGLIDGKFAARNGKPSVHT